MKFFKSEINRLVKDEHGGEMLEYALIAGLIVVACIALIVTVGGKIQTVWTNVSTGLENSGATTASTAGSS